MWIWIPSLKPTQKLFCSKNIILHDHMLTNHNFDYTHLYFEVMFLYVSNTFLRSSMHIFLMYNQINISNIQKMVYNFAVSTNIAAYLVSYAYGIKNVLVLSRSLCRFWMFIESLIFCYHGPKGPTNTHLVSMPLMLIAQDWTLEHFSSNKRFMSVNWPNTYDVNYVLHSPNMSSTINHNYPVSFDLLPKG